MIRAWPSTQRRANAQKRDFLAEKGCEQARRSYTFRLELAAGAALCHGIGISKFSAECGTEVVRAWKPAPGTAANSCEFCIDVIQRRQETLHW